MTAPRPAAPVPVEARARNGDAAAMLDLARQGLAAGDEAQRAEGEAWLRGAAAAWHVPARLELGLRLLAGHGLAEDPAAGRTMLASIAGRDPAAAVALADYDAGADPTALAAGAAPLDPAVAAALKADGEAGDAAAWHELGLRRWLAGGPNQAPLAREAFQAAAREGHVAAQYWLARAIRLGTRARGLAPHVVATETERADYWLQQAAERGSIEAMEDLAATIPAWRARAAEAGSARSAFQLGDAAYRGDGAPFDLGAARSWLRRAAAAGHGPAAALLARVFDATPGEPDDPAVRRGWHLAAAEAGNAAAFEPLAGMLEVGAGGPADPLAAARWYELAARLGGVDAACAAARLRLRAGADLRADPATLRAALVAVDRLAEAERETGPATEPLLAAFGTLAAARMALAEHALDVAAGGRGPAEALAWYLAAAEDLTTVPEVAVPALIAAARLFERTRVMPMERFPSRAPRFQGCIPDRAVAVPDAGELARRAAGWALAQAGVTPSEVAPSGDLGPLVAAAWRLWRRDVDGHRRDGLPYEEARARFLADLDAFEATWGGEAPALGGVRAVHPGDAPALGER